MKRETHKSYADQLKDPRWFEFCKRIQNVRGSQCEQCGTEERLQVHHCGYRDELLAWEYQADDMMIVCDECHAQFHKFADDLWNECLKLRNPWVIYEAGKKVRQYMRLMQPVEIEPKTF